MEFNSVNTFSIRRRALSGALAGLLVLAACGDDDDDAAEDAVSEVTDAVDDAAGAVDRDGDARVLVGERVAGGDRDGLDS
ncbi:MAG: hypothetical protein M3487_08565 [Actinomycetota bacterium]|nr:hypothetical protein [Actinomycetota bacterium]